jgi:hypothetical protein
MNSETGIRTRFLVTVFPMIIMRVPEDNIPQVLQLASYMNEREIGDDVLLAAQRFTKEWSENVSSSQAS